MLNKFFGIFFIAFPLICFGSSGSSPPFGMLLSQMINLGLLIALIFFSQRKNIREVFKSKRDQYLKDIKSARKSKKQAQKTLEEIICKFNEISENFDGKVREARQKAENSYQDQLIKAREQAKFLKASAEESFQLEIQKQIELLKKESLKKVTGFAKKEIKEKFELEQLKDWNRHFSTGN